MEENEEFDSDFNTEDIPISEEFWNYMENYWHNNREFPESTEVSLSKKADLINGKVPSSQLPSYVDDVLEFNTFESLPDSGEKGKIYLITNNNTQFRWSGSEYIQLNSDENVVTTNTDQRIDGKKSFITAGGSKYINHSLRVFSGDGSNPGLTFYKDGFDSAVMYFDAVGNFKFRNANDTVSRYVFAQGYKKDGFDDNSFLTAGGGSVLRSSYPTTIQADSKYIPYTGATANINFNAKPIANVGTIDATAFRNGTSSALVKSLSIGNTAVTSFGIKLTNSGTSNMMGSFTVTIFGYTGQTLSFRVSMYKYMYNWYVPTITWLHGDSAKISKIEFYKEDDSNLHLKVNFTINFGSYHKSVITDVLANTGDALHNPETYTLSINPDNSAHTLVQTTTSTNGFVRDSILPVNGNHITTNTNQSGLTGDKVTSGAWTFNNDVRLNRNGLTSSNPFTFRTNNSLRWAFRLDSETGTDNIGGNFTLTNYTDTGTYISTPLTIIRSTGAVRLSNLAGIGNRTVLADASGNLYTQSIPTTGYYNSNSIVGLNVLSTAVTTLDSYLPTGGFINGYGVPNWGGSDSPTGASYGGYIKFSNQGDNNNLDFYYNNGHNSTTAHRLWFRTKNGSNGTTNWLEVATREWANSQLSSYVSQSALNTQLGNYAKLNGIQTFSGTNTFSQNIEIPFATNANHAVNLGLMSDYVDSNTNDIMAYISQNFIGTSHIVNGVTSSNINNWNTVFGWGNHATADYTTQSWINSQDYANTAFVEESINKMCLEITDPDHPINAKNQFITVIITDNFSEEKINWEGFYPEQHISVINTGSKILDLNFQGQPFDKIEEKQTSEYYVNRDKKLIKKGTYKSAEILI
ncbi:hypothetical protein AB4Y90_01405 [Chryseobacterium sp. 2TAF14]|uniref:hypothetical protein n=1 Tax=Chryseobacterium sp. 2TAF14 TaxID=3233007 RepID=UPI003F90AE8C